MKQPTFPMVMREGALSVKIYKVRAKATGYTFFQLCYSLAGKRERKSFADLDAARREARMALGKISTGKATVAGMGNTDRESFVECKRLLRPLGEKALHLAVAEYVTAAKLLPEGASLSDAAREYATRHRSQLKPRLLAEAVAEFLERKAKDGMSLRYVQSLRSHLSRLAANFKKPMSSISTRDLEHWLDAQKVKGRTRNNLRLSIVTLWRWARVQGYIARDMETEGDRLGTVRDRGGKIGILTPAQLAGLLQGAPDDEARLYIAIGAFSGIRSAELVRLDWRDIREDRGVIEVGADKSKTATRRLVPIHPALAAWLARAPRGEGRVFSSEKAVPRVIAYAKHLLGEWPSNALRHSYATYRLAEAKDAARVALEMGNSPMMLFQNYRELADEKQAAAWFSIVPAQPANVLRMKGVAR